VAALKSPRREGKKELENLPRKKELCPPKIFPGDDAN